MKIMRYNFRACLFCGGNVNNPDHHDSLIHKRKEEQLRTQFDTWLNSEEGQKVLKDIKDRRKSK